MFAFFYYFYSAHPRSHFTALWYHFTFGRSFAISSRMVLTECGHVMPNSQWIQTNENAERANWIKSEPCWICKKRKKQIHKNQKSLTCTHETCWIYNLSIKLVVRGVWLSCGNELINIRIGFWLLFFFLLFLFIFLCSSVLMFTLLLLLRCQNDISARPKNWFWHFCQSNGRIVELVHVTASLCTNKTCELCTSVFT